ncbi:hypothetical protein AAC387_Pa04g0977 [Persea americana]
MVKAHLEENGMDKTYTRWLFHGEDFEEMSEDEDDDGEVGVEQRCDGLQEMLADLCVGTYEMEINVENIPQGEASSSHGPSAADEDQQPSYAMSNDLDPQPFDAMLNDLHLPLYPGCKKFSKLEFLVKLMHVKIINRWSNKSFDMNLELIKAALPTGETLPKSYYEAKKYMRDLGLGYVPIHACKYDCALFWREHEHKTNCPECGEPRYKLNKGKGKKIPQNVLRYFPLKPRLQRLFISRKTAKDMRWHKEKRVREDNVYRHPADSQAREEFDKGYQWFAKDPHNVRLGLASDGFNPFGDMSNSYGMWPVMLIPYNLPP